MEAVAAGKREKQLALPGIRQADLVFGFLLGSGGKAVLETIERFGRGGGFPGGLAGCEECFHLADFIDDFVAGHESMSHHPTENLCSKVSVGAIGWGIVLPTHWALQA